MPRGGHSKVGRVGRAAGQALRQQGQLVEAPDHLTEAERKLWDFYAPVLAAAGRLSPASRDVLAKYIAALATHNRLKAQQAAPEYKDVIISVTIDSAGNEHVTAKPNPLVTMVRQWAGLCRLYEADLLLSPAALVRAPMPAGTTEAPNEFFGGLRVV